MTIKLEVASRTAYFSPKDSSSVFKPRTQLSLARRYTINGGCASAGSPMCHMNSKLIFRATHGHLGSRNRLVALGPVALLGWKEKLCHKVMIKPTVYDCVIFLTLLSYVTLNIFPTSFACMPSYFSSSPPPPHVTIPSAASLSVWISRNGLVMWQEREKVCDSRRDNPI